MENSRKDFLIKYAIVVVVIFVLLCIIGAAISNNSNRYLKQGDYAQAYNTARDGKKDFIMKENAVGYCYQDMFGEQKIFIYPTLLNAWYENDSKNVLIKVTSTNTSTDTYVFFTYGDKSKTYIVESVVGENLS